MDETLPLLEQQRSVASTPQVLSDDLSKRDIVDFNPDGDDENPLDWPQRYKWGIVLLLALTHFTM